MCFSPELGHWWWRKSASPTLICSGASEVDASRAMQIAEVAAASCGLDGKQLQAAFAGKVAVHNAQQDQRRPAGTPRSDCLALSSFVRRWQPFEIQVQTEAEEKAASAKVASRVIATEQGVQADGVSSESEEEAEEEDGGRGLVCRDELAPALLNAIAAVTTTPV